MIKMSIVETVPHHMVINHGGMGHVGMEIILDIIMGRIGRVQLPIVTIMVRFTSEEELVK